MYNVVGAFLTLAGVSFLQGRTGGPGLPGKQGIAGWPGPEGPKVGGQANKMFTHDVEKIKCQF